MTETIAARTLVKSPPELWEACSHATTLARHLSDVGELTITRLEPETTVAWEGERICGTVRIEPAEWGTRVTLTAGPRVPDAVTTEMATLRTPEDGRALGARGYRRHRGMLGRLLERLLGSDRYFDPPAELPGLEPEPEPGPASSDHVTDLLPDAALQAALDSLGQAHHRPFSRG